MIYSEKESDGNGYELIMIIIMEWLWTEELIQVVVCIIEMKFIELDQWIALIGPDEEIEW